MLQLVAARVETSRAEYFLPACADQLLGYLRVDGGEIAASIFGLLRYMLALNQGHVVQCRQSGMFSQAVACVSAGDEEHLQAADSPITNTRLPCTSSRCEAALLFLAHGVTDALVLQTVLSNLPPPFLLSLSLEAKEITFLETVVNLFTVSHINPLAGLCVSAPSAVALLRVLLDRAILFLETAQCTGSQDPVQMAALGRCFRHISRGHWASPHLVCESLSERKSALIALIRDVQNAPGREGSGGSRGDEALAAAALMDISAVLAGWVDVCWRGLPGSDESIQQLIRSADNHSICASSGTDVGGRSELEPPPPRPKWAQSSLDGGGGVLPDENYKICPLPQEGTGWVEEQRGEVSLGVTQERLSAFTTEWEVDSTEEVCRKICALVGVSRSQAQSQMGDAVLSESGVGAEELAEVLVELIVDERHGISEVPGALEKCVQLLTDAAETGAAPAAIALGALDSILDIMSSWVNMTDSFLMQTCLSALIVLAQRQSSCRKVILNSLDKVDTVMVRVGSPVFLYAALKLCRVVVSGMNKLSLDGEALVMSWVMRCFHTAWTPLVMYACQLILDLASVNRPLLFKVCSRRELEDPLIRIVRDSHDISTVLTSLRTLAALAANFNDRPFWYYDSWTLPLLSPVKAREFSSVSFMHTLLDAKKTFSDPLDLMILSYGLTTLTFLREIPSIRDNPDHALQYHRLFIPELARLLSVISQTHQYMSTNDMHRPAEVCSRTQDFQDSIYQYLLSVELRRSNESYELMCASAVQTLHALVCCGDFRDLSLYEQYEDEFCETPVCEAVLYIMMQLPRNYIVQVKGMSIAQKLVGNGYGLRIFGECCSKVFIGALVAFSEDSGVHRAFCSIVNSLAQWNEFERTRLVSSAVFKWLYIVIKAGSPENAPLACMAIRSIADSEERAEAMGNAGMVKAVVLLLDKHASVLKVQMEGLRTIVALCKSQMCFRQFKSAGGVKRVKRTRAFLRSVLALSRDGQSPPMLEQSPYVAEDLAELLDMSSPGKLGEKCVVS